MCSTYIIKKENKEVVFWGFFTFYCESLSFQVLFLDLSQGLAFWAPGWDMQRVSCLGNCVFPGCLRGTESLEQTVAALFSKSPDPAQPPGLCHHIALDTEPHTPALLSCSGLQPHSTLNQASRPTYYFFPPVFIWALQPEPLFLLFSFLS